MESFTQRFASFMICITILAFSQLALAQNSPQDYLDAHNAARRKVGVDPIAWDDNVAAYATNYANQRAGDCALQHSTNGSYGENIFVGPGAEYTATDAVNLWVSESQYYDYYSNTCTDGQECRHYTQVVWRSSGRLGCARVKCSGGGIFGDGGIFITCNYDPPGNIGDQKPY